MTAITRIRLATPQDAALIAEMSRDYVEHGLGWSWTAARVLAAVNNRATNVAVAGELAGFGLMHYGDDSAHLALLAVRPAPAATRSGHTAAGLAGEAGARGGH